MIPKRAVRRWRAVVGVVLLGSGFVWLGPSSAAPVDGTFRALASFGDGGAWAVRADGAFVAVGDAPAAVSPAGAAVPVDVDVDAATGGMPVLLRDDGSVTQIGGLTVTCPKVSRWWPAVGVALTDHGRGAWVAALNGQVVNCGGAPDLAPRDPSYEAPVVRVTSTADGGGYYLLTAAGQVLPFGTAAPYGNGVPGSSRFVGMATTAKGYWLARADGIVQAFGDATAFGPTNPSGLWVVDIAATTSRQGYRLLTAGGDVLSFGPIPIIGDAQPRTAIAVADTFEAGPGAWTSWWGAPTPQVVLDGHRGGSALSVPGTWRAFGNVTRTVDGLTGGRTYRLSYWVKGDASVGGEFNWSTPTWTTVGSGRLPATASTARGWTLVTSELSAPAGATRLWLGLYADATFVLDDVTLAGPVWDAVATTTTVSSSSASSSPSGPVPPSTSIASVPTTGAPPAPTTAAAAPPAGMPPTTATAPAPATTTTAPSPPVVPTLPATPAPMPRVGRAPTGPDDIDARICGSARLLGGPISAQAAGALYPGRTVVSVPAGDDSAAFNGAAGTVYWFAPGAHTLGSSPFGQVTPRNDDVFIGAPGAVLDGGGVNRYAFVGAAARVAIRFLTVTGFQAPVNEGVVNHDSGNGWLIEYSTIRANGGGGMMAGSGQVVRWSCLAENGQYGFNAYQGGDGIADVIFDHNEISGNNTGDWEVRQPGCGCTGGGKFWSVKGARVTNNWVHDNKSVGLWADTNNVDFLFERNVVDHNDSVGIWYEISYNARIVDNLLARNGWVSSHRDQGSPAPAIYLSESGGDARLRSSTAGAPLIEITGNSVVDNFSGITLYENTNRFCNSNGNSSTGYCTPFVTGGKIPDPHTYTYGIPVNAAHACTAPGLASEPLYTDCRWRTQHVAIHDNAFAFDPAVVPCVGRYCGVMALYGSGSDNQSWQPYKVAATIQAVMFGQDNHWTNNTYRGPWRFSVVYGDPTDTAAWRTTYGQDGGSTFG